MSESNEIKRRPMGTAVLTPAIRTEIGEAILHYQRPLGKVMRDRGIGLNVALECAIQYHRAKTSTAGEEGYRHGKLSVMPNLPPKPPNKPKTPGGAKRAA